MGLSKSTLYMVAVPIGNLDDITYRAVKVLSEVDVIASEDTRTTRFLLKYYNIQSKRLIAVEAHNEAVAANGVVKLLEEGNSVAYVSEAGTPAVSDPGSRLVEEVLKNTFTVVPIPGSSAVLSLISSAGNIGKAWTFEGFLPKTSGKMNRRITELLERNEAFVLYESPFRILKLLEALNSLCPNRIAVIGRELTKLHEEIIKAPVSEIYNDFKNRASIKGEFVIIITPFDVTSCENNQNSV